MKIRRFSVELTTRSLRIALTGALICSAIFPPAHGSAQSSFSLETFPGELPKPIATRVAKEWFFAFRSGQVDRRKLSDAVNNELSASVLQKEMRTLQRFGTPRSFEYLRVARFGGLPTYEVVVSYANTERKVIEGIAFDGNGKLAGIDFEIVAPENAPAH